MIKSDPLERIKIDLMRIVNQQLPKEFVDNYGLNYVRAADIAYENVLQEVRAILAYIEKEQVK